MSTPLDKSEPFLQLVLKIPVVCVEAVLSHGQHTTLVRLEETMRLSLELVLILNLSLQKPDLCYSCYVLPLLPICAIQVARGAMASYRRQRTEACSPLSRHVEFLQRYLCRGRPI